MYERRQRTGGQDPRDEWDRASKSDTSRIDEYRRSPDPSLRGTYSYTKAPSDTSRNTNEIAFDEAVQSVARLVAATVISKQNDYGPNNIRKSPFGEHVGLVVRLYDKLSRLANLTSSKKKPENESVKDTYMDIAGYGIIGLMILNGTFPKE